MFGKKTKISDVVLIGANLYCSFLKACERENE